jgi:protein-S-isoprenylcysteine O-methyltransferase Ste14
MNAAKTAFWIVAVHGTVLILAPYFILQANIQLVSGELPALRFIGVLPVLVGCLIVLWCARDLTVSGAGTPAPMDPPRRLVVRGLYRFVRNPMYAGDLLVLLGESLLYESVILTVYGLAMFGVFHLFILWHEEPALKRRFGESYQQYCKAVRRWIPSFQP